MHRKRARRYSRLELECVAKHAYRAGIAHGRAQEQAGEAGVPLALQSDAHELAITAGLAAASQPGSARRDRLDPIGAR